MKNLYIKEKVKLLLHLIKPNKKHNITYYPRINCIFIGVPKCANSAINAFLLKEEENTQTNFKGIPYSEIHKQKAKFKFLILKILTFSEWLLLLIVPTKPGSKNWLIKKEFAYGGLSKDVKRKKISPNDKRDSSIIASTQLTGGDRMSPIFHGYAATYAKYLTPFINIDSKITLVEVGILKGTGLAIWSDLFPTGNILGLDIDTSNVDIEHLKSIGAFSNNNIELHEFDQLEENQEYLFKILNGNKIDIFIDDGLHTNEAIMTTLESVKDYLADAFVCFIEDNANVHKLIKETYPSWYVTNYGRMTVIKPSKN